METVTLSCHAHCQHCLDLDRLAALSGLTERATPQYDLRAKYDAFNQQFFGGELPTDITLDWFTSKRMGGVATCKFRRSDTHLISGGTTTVVPKGIVPGTLTIKISTLYKRSEESLDAILIHEMIHVHFFVKNRWDENHGYMFLALAAEIGYKAGFKIPVTDDVSGLELADDKPKPVGVIFVHRRNGGMAMVLTTPTVVQNGGEQIIAYWKRFGSYAQRVTGLVVTDSEWTKLAAKYPIQRTTGGKKAKLYAMPSEEVIKRINPTNSFMCFNEDLTQEPRFYHNALGDET